MKKYNSVSKILVMAISILFIAPGCLKDKLTKTYSILRPVYESKTTVLANIKSNQPVSLKEPGKIYLYGQYIFLNEINKGVHIINNANPSSPVNVAFINIPGNLDIAVKGNILYADLYTDLLSIDISNPLQAKLTKVLPHIFPEREYGNGFNPDTTMIIVDWIKKDTTIDISVNENGGGSGCPNCWFLSAAQDNNKNNAFVPGIAGSMSRFALVNDYLYAVNNSSLETISVSEASDPKYLRSNPMGWNIETIYPFKDKLFIGSSTGLFIFDIANPAMPEFKGTFTHFRACDPVVADDVYAYVTLRTGTFCEGTSNQLDIVNVQNLNAPALIKTYAMTNPHGLAKDGSTLFICDGKDGLKVYDATVASNLKLMHHLKGMVTYDAIAWNKRLLLVTQTGLLQYDYSDLNQIRLLSTISINR